MSINTKTTHPLILSALINLLLFTLFTFFSTPLYDTNEDVFILYTLGGGFGAAPSGLLHYNYGMHPLLGSVISQLFRTYPNINWYTWTLLFAHFGATTYIASRIVGSTDKKLMGLLIYSTLFIVYEGRLLLNINFSNTSIVLASAAVVEMACYRQTDLRRYWFIPVLFLLTGSLFRIHTLIPVLGISLPFLLFPLFKRNLARNGLVILVALTGILLLNQWQMGWYRSSIPGWAEEENYRQHIYSFYNNRTLYRPAPGEQWYTEHALIRAGIALDTQFISISKMEAMHATFEKKQNKNYKFVKTTAQRWFWINNRLLFLTTLLVLVYGSFTRQRGLIPWLSVGLLTTGLLMLGLTRKMPDYLLATSLFAISCLTCCLPEKTAAGKPSQHMYFIWLTLLALLSGWGIIRFVKTSNQNQHAFQSFAYDYATVRAKPNNLFIINAAQFPLQKFNAWQTPINYPLYNLIFEEHFLNNQVTPILNRFNCQDIHQLPFRKNILFWGADTTVLKNYFRESINLDTRIVQEQPGFPAQPVFRIISQQLKTGDQ